MRLRGAVVLVTGASRGIGRSTAELLTQRGALVLPVGRAAADLPADGLVADLRDPDAAERLVSLALARHSRLDAVLSIAGVGHAGDLADMPADRVSELVEVNLLAPLQLARAALPHLRAQGAGTLLFVTSIAGALGVPGESVYSATKAGLETFADTLRAELRGDGVVVTTVLPGVVATDFFAARGQAYDRRVPRPVTAASAARQVVAALEHDRRQVISPRWLTVPARLRGLAPGLYRRLERRLG